MPTVVIDLFAWAEARERERVEAALAVVNAGSRPDDGRAPYHNARAARDIDAKCRMWPTAGQVAALVTTHGVHAVWERWAWVSQKELACLARAGGAREVRA